MTAPLVVIGDLMLDLDLVGRADRLSPEAPVPVLSAMTELQRPGGAGLAAWLAASSGTRRVVLVAPDAGDEAARRVWTMLDGAGAGKLELVAVPSGGATPVKTRIRVGSHPVARLDSGDELGEVGPLPERAREAIAGAAAVLVCDYGRRAVAEGELRAAIARMAGQVPVVWDPHPLGSMPVPGCAIITPNESELLGFAGAAGKPAGLGTKTLAEAARFMARRWQARAVAVTRGANGVMLCLGDNAPLIIPSEQVQAIDTCGAGDSFAAAAALAMADGRLPSEAASLAVRAAHRFVADGAASSIELGPRRPPSRSLDLQFAQGVCPSTDAHGAAGRGDRPTVVATGGCFDLLHAGHVAALEAARSLGDRLTVCLNSDASVRRLKGADRPLQPQEDRAKVLQALRCVDEVVVFDEDTPTEVLRRIRPDIWVKGGDYSGADLPEATVLADWGGEAVIVPYLPGRSTSNLVELLDLAIHPPAR